MKQLLIIGMAILTLQVSAQEKKDGKRGEARMERMDRMKKMSPQERADMATIRMTKALDLSKDQQEKVKALHLKQAEKMQAMMAQRESMKNSDENTKPTPEQREAFRKQRMTAREDMQKELKSILTDSQYQEWETRKERMKQRGDSMRKEGRERKKK